MRLRFQMRPVNGKQHVFLSSVDGVPIPAGNQSPVFSHTSAWLVQAVSDALNRGLLDRVLEVAGRAKAVQEQSQARRRMEER